MKSFNLLILIPLFFSLYLLLPELVTALDANGSTYSVGEFSTTVISGSGNSSNISAGTGSFSQPIVNDAQGLENGAVIGISGTATLTPNKIPIINSYSVTSSVNQSLPVRLFVSAVYTSKVSVDITRPNSVVDNIDMMQQSVYYYPYTDLVGRYTVKFSAEGNGVVTAETYFDVVEPIVTPPVTPPVNQNNGGGSSGSGGSNSGYIAPNNKMYVSVSIYCVDTATVIVKVTNETSPLSRVLITLNSSNILMNASTDEKGTATFDVESGNYTIAAYNSGYDAVIHDYEAYCADTDINNSLTGNIVSNEPTPNITPNDLEKEVNANNSLNSATAAALVESSKKSLSMSIISLIMAGSTAILSTLILFIVLLMLIYNLVVSRTPKESYVFNGRVGPILYSENAKPSAGFGVYHPNKTIASTSTSSTLTYPSSSELTPVEKAMIDTDKEVLWNIKTEDLDGKKQDKEIKAEIKKNVMIDLQESIVKPVEPTIKPTIGPIVKPTIESLLSPKLSPTTPAVTVPAVSPAVSEPIILNVDQKIVPKMPKKIIDVPEGQEFISCSGEHIYNIPDLLIELRYISDDVFNYHVTSYKNDFATWIYHVVGDKELAIALGPVKSKTEMIYLIKKRLDS